MKKLVLLVALLVTALFLSNASIAATEFSELASNSFPMDIRVIVNDDANEIALVTELGNKGFDYIYQAGVKDWEDGKVALTFLLHSQEELDYFNNSGLIFEIVEPEPVGPEELKSFAMQAVSLQSNSAYWYSVREDDGFIVGILGGSGNRNINPGYVMRENVLNGTDVFDPTGVTFNETYGFPNRAGYRTAEEYYGEMFYLAKTYPHLVKIHKIGDSWYYPIYALEICNAPGVEDGRIEWLSLAAQHAREWPANELTMNTAWWFTTQYDKYLKGDKTVEPKLIEIMEKIRTWCVPMYNPDGTWYDQSGVNSGTNRSNRRPGASYVSSATNEVLEDYKTGGTNNHGRFYETSTNAATGNQPVDINRNFAYRWGSNDGSSTQASNTGSSTHRGFFPMSEPENQAVASLVSRRMIMSDFAGHTFGGLAIYLWDNKKSLAVTENMNFEDLGRIIARHNNYNDYHTRAIYGSCGGGIGLMYGAYRSLSFAYEMGFDYATTAVNFVPPFNGASNVFRVAIGNFNDMNPNLSINGLNGSVNGVFGPGVTSDVPKGTFVSPLRYNTNANTGIIQSEVTAPVVVMMPECETNIHNSTNCLRDAYGNPTAECQYHNTFQTSYTTSELLSTSARLAQILSTNPDFVKDKILLCYNGANAINNTAFVQNARDAGAVAVLFAQVGTANNGDSSHAFTGGPAMNAISGDAIPVALITRPFARSIHDNVKEMAAKGSVATLTLKPGFYNWNTQLMEWERNCYSFLELALFSLNYAGAITGKVTGNDDAVVKGVRLDLSLNVKAPTLRPEYSSDTFFWDQSVLTATTANNIHSQVDRIGSKLTKYIHPTTGDTINVTNWQHTSYIDQFSADGSFKWNVAPSTQFDAYMYEGLRQPPLASGTAARFQRGYSGGFEAESATDPRIGTLLFPNDGYKVTASAPGYYNYARQIVVRDYKVSVNADFKLAEAITAGINAGSFWSVVGENRIPFSTFVLNEANNTSVKGVVEGATVNATIDGKPAQVVSLNNGNYEIVFKAVDFGLALNDEAELVIGFTDAPDHSAYVNTIVIGVAAAAPGITGPTSMTLIKGYAATSTGAYTITGNPAPTVEKLSGNALITWNDTTLNIAKGLAAGTYHVVLRASNGISPDATLTFTLKVEADPDCEWGCNAVGCSLVVICLFGAALTQLCKKCKKK